MIEGEVREHEALAAEAEVLDDAIKTVQRQLDRDALAAVENTQRFLALRFLPHAHRDEEHCARLALRDHRHPEGRCGEPEVEMMTTRLDHIRATLEKGDFSDSVGSLLRTLLRELRPFVYAHLADTAGSEPPSTSRAADHSRKG